MMQESLFYELSLERRVPPDHLFLPSIDPGLMIRMLIDGHCFGILLVLPGPTSRASRPTPAWIRADANPQRSAGEADEVDRDALAASGRSVRECRDALDDSACAVKPKFVSSLTRLSKR